MINPTDRYSIVAVKIIHRLIGIARQYTLRYRLLYNSLVLKDQARYPLPSLTVFARFIFQFYQPVE